MKWLSLGDAPKLQDEALGKAKKSLFNQIMNDVYLNVKRISDVIM
jgi:hypothetical protein